MSPSSFCPRNLGFRPPPHSFAAQSSARCQCILPYTTRYTTLPRQLIQYARISLHFHHTPPRTQNVRDYSHPIRCNSICRVLVLALQMRSQGKASRYPRPVWLTRKFRVDALPGPRRWSPTFQDSVFRFRLCQRSDCSFPNYPTRCGRILDLPFRPDSNTQVSLRSSNATRSHFVHGTAERYCTLATSPSSPGYARMLPARCSRSQLKNTPSSATSVTTW